MNLFLLEGISKFALYFEAIKWNNLRIVRVILANQAIMPSLPWEMLPAFTSFTWSRSQPFCPYTRAWCAVFHHCQQWFCVCFRGVPLENRPAVRFPVYPFVILGHIQSLLLYLSNSSYGCYAMILELISQLILYFLFILLLLLHYFFCSTFKLS